MELCSSENPLAEAECGSSLDGVLAKGFLRFEVVFLPPTCFPLLMLFRLPFLSQMAPACRKVVGTAHTAGIPLGSRAS